MKIKYYTYSDTTKRLIPAKNPADIGGRRVTNPTREMYATIGAYPVADPMPPAPTPPEGKRVIPDGYKIIDTADGKAWARAYRFDDPPQPTVADYDAAMEEHLRNEREERGYTTREPDAYLNSEVPRWKQDAEDWVAHRDEVMEFALDLMNAVERGAREPPTMAEFKAGLPRIEWTDGTDGTGGTDGTNGADGTNGTEE